MAEKEYCSMKVNIRPVSSEEADYVGISLSSVSACFQCDKCKITERFYLPFKREADEGFDSISEKVQTEMSNSRSELAGTVRYLRTKLILGRCEDISSFS